MGALICGNSSMEVCFEDRTLQHLQIVITAKLSRRESFVFSWVNTAEDGQGRSVIWLNPSSTLFYRFCGNRMPAINLDWLDTLMDSANSPNGLFLSPEPLLQNPRPESDRTLP